MTKYKPLKVSIPTGEPQNICTGDPAKWPNGVYRSIISPKYLVVVDFHYDEWVSLNGGHSWERAYNLGHNYTKIDNVTIEWTPTNVQKNITLVYP